jgi:hypothetical protein
MHRLLDLTVRLALDEPAGLDHNVADVHQPVLEVPARTTRTPGEPEVECRGRRSVWKEALSGSGDDRVLQQPVEVDKFGLVQCLNEFPAAVNLELLARKSFERAAVEFGS